MATKAPSIHSYQDARTYLLDWLLARQANEPTYSVRKWAREMEISHSLLVMLLQGKRTLKLKHASAFARGMSLSPSDKHYLQALIELANAKSLEEESLARRYIQDLYPQAQVSTREIDEFDMVASWIHFAILALCSVEGFDGTERFFAKRLRGKANTLEVRGAVSRLVTLGLLIRTAEGKFIAAQADATTPNERASSAVRKYHSEVSMLASKAVQEQEMAEREFQSFALAVHPDQIPMVKEMIRKFRAQLVGALSERKGSDVYNVNLQFFRLTERPAELSAEDEGVDTASHRLSQEDSHVHS